MNSCKCGCGGDIIILPHHKNRGIPKYIHGHNFKKCVGDGHQIKKGNIPWNKGKTDIYSEDTITRISNSLKGNIPWNKGTIGIMKAWNKGIPMLEESKQKCRDSNKGRHLSPSTEFKKGKMSGENHPNYGNKYTDELRKKLSEAHIGIQAMENHPNWKGGISFEPYCHKFNGSLKEYIRERDNRTCQCCGKSEEDNGKKLAVHHIHYDKPNCDPDLTALCISCNSIVNQNRDIWEEYFTTRLESRGIIEMRNEPDTFWNFHEVI